MNETVLDAIGPREWTARYEQLRGDALNRGSGLSSGIGLAVFLRHGLRAWMRACGRVVTLSVSQFAPPAPVNGLPFEVRTQAVLILTGMLLRNRSEAT